MAVDKLMSDWHDQYDLADALPATTADELPPVGECAGQTHGRSNNVAFSVPPLLPSVRS